MKNIFIFLFSLSFTVSFSQKGFDTKKKDLTKKEDSGSNSTQFELIDGSKKSVTLSNSNLKVRLNQLVNSEVVKNPETGAVIFFRNKSKASTADVNKSSKINAIERTFSFFEENKSIFKIDNPRHEFQFLESNFDDLGVEHLKFQQKLNNLPIYGAELLVHLKNNNVETINGNILPSLKFESGEAISLERVISNIKVDLSKNGVILQEYGLNNKFFNTKKESVELLIYPKASHNYLAYQVVYKPNILERWVYFVNAQTGEVIDKYNHTCTLDGIITAKAKDLNGLTQTFNVLQSNNTYYMIDASKNIYNATQSKLPDSPVGVIWTIDANNSKISDEEMNLSHVTSVNGSSWSPTSVSAQANASFCFEYFKNKHGRKSLNDKGGSIVSVININDEDGKGMDNAYWNGEFMGYGNGKTSFKPLAGALDVAAHEMTHGVVENTAKLEYRNQSGALNESFADVFGALIDTKNWTLGEEVVIKTEFPSGALRSLENPNQGGKRDPGYQPKTMSQYVYLKDTPSEDNGGVHVNSGIPNYAFYLFATTNGVGRENAEKVYYRALTKYLTRTSKFVDARLAVIQASKDLYGENSAITKAASEAFTAVGILDPGSSTSGGGSNPAPQPTTPSTIPVNPGSENLIAYDPNDGSLYKMGFPITASTNFVLISDKLGSLGKPSVSDDGSIVYFVGKDNKIYSVNLTQANAKPVLRSEDAVWRNVAVSKNGKLLAALNKTTDKFIYVFNLETGKSSKFKLYNPTYTTGVSTGEVLYADSFEWDYSGENIIYDAFNKASSTFGSFEYWDVGIINVWNSASNVFAQGTVEKLFTDLEEGDNIGNPGLSKTSPGIIAFDYYDSENEKYYLISTNLNTNDLVSIYENNTISYPDYSKSDNKLIFNSLNGKSETIKYIDIAKDKISPVNDSPTEILVDAKWGVWFAQGQRVLPTKTNQTITFSAITDKLPGLSFILNATSTSGLPLQYSVVSGDAVIQGNTLKLGNTPGKVNIKAFQTGTELFAAASAEQTFCIMPNTPSIISSNNSLIASGGSTYQWYVNESPLGGQTTSNTIKTEFQGSYSVKSITIDGCFSNFSNAIGVVATSNEPILKNEIKLYPNPLNNRLKIELSDNSEIIQKVEFVNANGQAIKTSSLNNIPVDDLRAGIYLVKVKTNKGLKTFKLVK